jgi:hypothetical protein
MEATLTVTPLAEKLSRIRISKLARFPENLHFPAMHPVFGRKRAVKLHVTAR